MKSQKIAQKSSKHHFISRLFIAILKIVPICDSLMDLESYPHPYVYSLQESHKTMGPHCCFTFRSRLDWFLHSRKEKGLAPKTSIFPSQKELVLHETSPNWQAHLNTVESTHNNIENNGQINWLTAAIYQLIGWSITKDQFWWCAYYSGKGILHWFPCFYVQIRLLHPVMQRTKLL